MSQKSDLTSWKNSRRHTITLPSGSVVEIEIPNLPLLAKTGKLPNHLLDAVFKVQSASKITREMLEDQEELTNELVAITVVEPELTPEDVREIPYEDADMIVEFALRARDMDAVGHHLGGLEQVESFRDIRGL